ncbi:Alpha/Beta hydrolase protein [Emericellopsis atlantica]|uniref:Alpha/Beta hydrolase protein n=1 Tax=Emericellopsis atlantica TaxID=2614577 RepID=A0A9P7ZRB1_9HYPO|nr:Alpha/Beta hydrolase protein [Emericellopsis atlantica]KAG9256218.1 Alpha/Beta hydrolase protein [Emericellopsis atlantica]
MPTPGLLQALMHPKPTLEPPVFDEWYQNEHGPTRVRMPDIFGNGLRYRALDDREPKFAAIYDVKDIHDLETDRYLTLRANRSKREASVVAQIHITRGFWDLIHEKSADGFKAPEDTTDQDALGRVLLAVDLTPNEDPQAKGELQKWYEEEHVNMLAKIPGWLRSRMYKTSVIEDGKATFKFLGLHEFAKSHGIGGPETQAALATPRAREVMSKYAASSDRRMYELFYVFGSGARDLENLSKLPSDAAFVSTDERTRTLVATGPVIESYVPMSDGLDLPYRLEGNKATDAPTVAFCNSLLTDLHMWDPLIELLKKERPDLRILRYDVRGRHAIPQPPKAATLDTVTADLHALLDGLRIPKPEALVGVSMGGATTLSFAIQHPDRLKKFVACDFNVTSSAANTQAWKDRIAVAEEDNGQGIKKLAEQTVARWFHPDTKPEIKGWMVDMVARNDVQGFANSCTALWDYDLKPNMGACTAPGLFVVGEVDGKGALVKAMDGFKGELGGHGAELKVVSGAGHLPMCEQPQGFWDAIREFL